MFSLHLRKSDGLPDTYGQLQNFTDNYQINIQYEINLVHTLYPILTVLHVKDKNICIPPEIFIGTAFHELMIQWMINTKLCVNFLMRSCQNQIAIGQDASIMYVIIYCIS